MVKRGGVFFAFAALVMSAVIWGNPLGQLTSSFWPQSADSQPIVETVPEADIVRNLTVSLDELMLHVTATAQPRYLPENKQAVRDYIANQLSALDIDVQLARYAHPETGSLETGGINIVATIPGRDPQAGTVVLGAHYDSVNGSPGANDNGTGIATLLEAARLLRDSSAQQPFLSTLKLVFFDQEEQQPDGSGLLGSLAYAQSEANTSNLKAAVVLDMVGYACRTPGCQQYPARLPLSDLPETGEFLAVLGLSRHPGLIEAFVDSARQQRPTILSLPIPSQMLTFMPDLLRSDHAPFWQAGVPAVFITDTANFRNPFYHTPQDTPENIDQAFFEGSAQHVINAIAALISTPSPAEGRS